jgi:hypothetical protein
MILQGSQAKTHFANVAPRFHCGRLCQGRDHFPPRVGNPSAGIRLGHYLPNRSRNLTEINFYTVIPKIPTRLSPGEAASFPQATSKLTTKYEQSQI